MRSPNQIDLVDRGGTGSSGWGHGFHPSKGGQTLTRAAQMHGFKNVRQVKCVSVRLGRVAAGLTTSEDRVLLELQH